MMENDKNSKVEENCEIRKDTPHIDDETIKEDKKQLIKEDFENIDKECTKKCNLKEGFLKNLCLGIKETIAKGIVSGIILLVMGLVFKYVLGFLIVKPWEMLFLIFIVVSILYPCFSKKLSKKK